MKTNNLIGKIATGAVLVGALAGCAGGNVQNYQPQKEQQKQEIYSSPVLPEEYGFRVVERMGDVDETDPKTGFSRAYASEQDARNDAIRNADCAKPTSIELIYVIDSKGKPGYVAEASGLNNP